MKTKILSIFLIVAFALPLFAKIPPEETHAAARRNAYSGIKYGTVAGFLAFAILTVKDCCFGPMINDGTSLSGASGLVVSVALGASMFSALGYLGIIPFEDLDEPLLPGIVDLTPG